MAENLAFGAILVVHNGHMFLLFARWKANSFDPWSWSVNSRKKFKTPHQWVMHAISIICHPGWRCIFPKLVQSIDSVLQCVKMVYLTRSRANEEFAVRITTPALLTSLPETVSRHVHFNGIVEIDTILQPESSGRWTDWEPDAREHMSLVN